MNTSDPFSRHHQLFAQLLTQTAHTPHGYYPLMQEDDQGSIWQIMMPVSTEIACRLLWEAHGADAKDLAQLSDFLPHLEEFTLFGGDDTYLLALWSTAQSYYVIRCEGRRYYDLLLRGKYRHSNSTYEQKVYQTLRQLYGINSVPPASPEVEEDRPTLIPE